MDGGSEPRFSRPAKIVLAALALTGLLIVVALAARGSDTIGHAQRRQVPSRVSDELLTLIIIAYGLGIVVLISQFLSMRRKWQPVKSNWLRQLGILWIAMGLFAVIGYKAIVNKRVRHLFHQQQVQQKGRPRTRTAKVRTVGSPPPGARAAHFDWELAIGLAGLALVGYAYVVIRARRDPLGEPIELDPVHQELSAALSDSIDDLRNEADPRRAVIAAYARMERVLGRHSHERLAAEAPFEYLARILVGLRVHAGAVRELTELFERAKFSTHSIDAGMKERAIAALVAVRDDLQAVPA